MASCRATYWSVSSDNHSHKSSATHPVASALREEAQKRAPRSRAARALKGAACSGPGGFICPPYYYSLDEGLARVWSVASFTALALDRKPIPNALHFDLNAAKHGPKLRLYS